MKINKEEIWRIAYIILFVSPGNNNKFNKWGNWGLKWKIK